MYLLIAVLFAGVSVRFVSTDIAMGCYGCYVFVRCVGYL